MGSLVQSVAVSGENIGFADKREAIDDGKILYRGAVGLGGGTLRFDADVTLVHDVPPSPIVRAGTALNDITPINANYQPADSKISENKYHLSLGYALPTSWGAWDSVVSFAHSDIRDVRGFLRPDLVDDGSANADSQNQYRLINDLYADSHLASDLGGGATLLVGADLLYGVGRQRSLNGEYYVPLERTDRRAAHHKPACGRDQQRRRSQGLRGAICAGRLETRRSLGCRRGPSPERNRRAQGLGAYRRL